MSARFGKAVKSGRKTLKLPKGKIPADADLVVTLSYKEGIGFYLLDEGRWVVSYLQQHHQRGVAAGADGYLQKFTGTEQLLAMVRDVAGGEYRMPRDVMRRVFRRLRHMPEEIDSPRRIRLTEREKEILTLILLQANSTSPRIFSYAHAHCTSALV